jgi:pimeloyl-ACP methyl ester carboxylesterase
LEKISSKDGTLIAYEKSGQGPALVLVHGTAADHSRWAPVLTQLQEKYTVFAVDRCGRGESEDHHKYSMEREFEDIANVVGSIPGQVNLLGHSYGAICSLEAAHISRNINKLILYEPPITMGADGIYPQETITEIKHKLDVGNIEGIVETFLREIPKVPPHEHELLKASPSWKGRVAAAHTILRELQASENGYHFTADRFSGLTTPTLLLLGGDSPGFFKDAIAKLHAVLPHNRVVVMPGQQHVAMNSAPNMFLKQVIGFLDEPR